MKTLGSILLVSMVLSMGEVHGVEVPENPPPLTNEVVYLETPGGIPFGLWGKKVAYPAPTLFVFSASVQESLGDPYYRQCGKTLADLGYLCVSLDLPGHGSDRREGEPEGLDAWRFRSDHDEDFVSPFTQQAKSVLDFLIESGYTAPDRVAVCGTSRGGFMALQFAAVEPRIRATAAFAPVTALGTLREFEGATDPSRVSELSLHARAGDLAGRSLWLVIGDRDKRVGTDEAIAFARAVTQSSIAKGKTADVTLIVKPEPKGHTTPEGSPNLAAEWIAEKLE